MVFILFLSCFICVISEVRINYNLFPTICMLMLLFFNYFTFHFACADIGVSTPAHLRKASRSRIGYTSRTGPFAIYFYIIYILLYFLFSLGSSLCLHPLLSCIHYNGSCSRSLAEGVFYCFVGIKPLYFI
jgi:hypothetical protein